MGSLHQHADLAQALQAAREEAHRRPIVKTTLAKGGEKNPEAEWYFAATDEMMLVALDILKAHGLRLNWEAMEVGPLGVTTFATLAHESGVSRAYTWGPLPAMEDAVTTTHGGLGTVRHAMRCLHLMILEIQVISMATADRLKREQSRSDLQEVKDAMERERTKLLAEPASDYQPPSTVSAEDHALPAWAEAGGLEPAAPLPGEEREPECSVCRCTFRWNEDADRYDQGTLLCNTCAQKIAHEADAAARGEVRDPPGAAELGLLLGRVRALTGKSGPELRRAAGVPERGPLDEGARAALFAHLSRLAGPEAT